MNFSNPFKNQKSVIMPLVTINIIAFILQMVTGMSNGWFTQIFILDSEKILVNLEFWRIITAMFLHADFFHIFINMYVLVSFGSLLQSRIGPKRLLLVYFVAGIIASTIATFFYPLALGASGAIMGIIGVVIILFPDLKVLFFFIIPMPLWVAGIVFALIDALHVVSGSPIGGAAHIAGMVTGLLFGLYFKKMKKNFQKKFKVKVHMGDKEIDAYLKHGRI